MVIVAEPKQVVAPGELLAEGDHLLGDNSFKVGTKIFSAAESSTWDFQVGRWTYARHMRRCSPPPRPRVRGDPGGGIYQSRLTLETWFCLKFSPSIERETLFSPRRAQA